MPLSDTWCQLIAPPSGAPSAEGLEQRLQAAVARSKEAYTEGFRTSDEHFVRYLAQRAAGAENPEAILTRPHLGDMYLAHACTERDSRALSTFEGRYATEIRLACGRIAPEAAEEIGQRVREKLFIQGKLAAYSGTGPLGAWLRAVVARTAIEWRRLGSNRPLVSSDGELARLVDPHDPELAQFRAEYMDVFKQAFQDALASLSARERTLLRLSVLERLTAEQIARAEGAHRVTVARRLGAVRDKLLDTTRALLMERLGLTPSEFGKVTRFCLSQIDVSLYRMLHDDPTDPDL